MTKRIVGRKLQDDPFEGDMFKRLNDDFFKDFDKDFKRTAVRWSVLTLAFGLLYVAGIAVIILAALKIAGVI